MHPRLDGAGRDTQLSGNLDLGEPLPIEEQDGAPLTRRQLGHSAFDRRRDLRRFEVLVGAGSREDLGRPVNGCPCTEIPSSPPGQIESDPTQPCPEPISGTKAVQTHQSDHGGLLDDVPGQVVVREQTGSERQGRRAMASNHLTQSSFVAVPRRHHQVGVRPCPSVFRFRHAL